MTNQNIAIVGLGRIGAAFLGAMQQQMYGINIVCVSELADTPAKARAIAAGIKIASLDEIASMEDKIDIVFDLTGIVSVRKELREKLHASNNNHTIIASETIVRMIWSMISDKALPVIEGRKKGY
jgi:glyceraldehyde-3-phosphate dehydrogenase/erythrose-4-phosphate dehydrogenase